jgi:hypothetical protein
MRFFLYQQHKKIPYSNTSNNLCKAFTKPSLNTEELMYAR